MSLQNLQAEFADGIFSDESSLDFIEPYENFIIYRNNIFSNLTRALKNVYPLIEKLVGEDFFPLAANTYAKHYPSRSGNLNDYGAYFGDFLAHFAPTKSLIYLPEVAQFEWACHLISRAENHGLLDTTLLQNMSPDLYPNLHFGLHPACMVMKFNYPILRIINLCKSDLDEEIELNEGGINLLIRRCDQDVSYLELSEAEYVFLSALNGGESLATALNTAQYVEPRFLLNEKLPTWVQDGTIVECYLA